MSTMLQMQLEPPAAKQVPIAETPAEQEEFSAAPQEFTFTTSAKGILFTVAAFYIIIYLLHVLERKVYG